MTYYVYYDILIPYAEGNNGLVEFDNKQEALENVLLLREKYGDEVKVVLIEGVELSV